MVRYNVKCKDDKNSWCNSCFSQHQFIYIGYKTFSKDINQETLHAGWIWKKPIPNEFFFFFDEKWFCVLEKQLMGNFCNLINFHRNFIFLNDQVIQKLQLLK